MSLLFGATHKYFDARELFKGEPVTLGAHDPQDIRDAAELLNCTVWELAIAFSFAAHEADSRSQAAGFDGIAQAAAAAA